MQEHIQNARFYELLGYALGVCAFAILGAGLIWSLRSHISEKRRTFFLIASLAVLLSSCGGVLMWLTLSQQLPLHTIGNSEPQRNQATIRDKAREAAAAPEIHLKADGTVLFQDEELALENLAAELRREPTNKQLTVLLRADRATPFEHVARVMTYLSKNGIPCSLSQRP